MLVLGIKEDKNIRMDSLLIDSFIMDLFDANNTAMKEHYLFDLAVPIDVTAGRNPFGQVAFILNNDENHIEIEVKTD